MSAADDARMALAASHLRAVSPFDALRIVDEHGAERWSARALMVRLGYSRWENLSRPLERAKATMRNVSGEDAVTTTFLRSQKVADRAQGGGSPGEDWLLTREAAYLVAMNGDPNKSMR